MIHHSNVEKSAVIIFNSNKYELLRYVYIKLEFAALLQNPTRSEWKSREVYTGTSFSKPKKYIKIVIDKVGNEGAKNPESITAESKPCHHFLLARR